jgi:hypothetical protein
MSDADAETGAEHRPGPLRRIADHLHHGHHHDAGASIDASVDAAMDASMNASMNVSVDASVDGELTRDAKLAGYDLSTDLAHPSPPHGVAGFDLEADIGRDNEPPELRR